MSDRRASNDNWIKANFLGLLIILGTILVYFAHAVAWQAGVTVEMQDIKRRLYSLECKVQSGCYQGGMFVPPIHDDAQKAVTIEQ